MLNANLVLLVFSLEALTLTFFFYFQFLFCYSFLLYFLRGSCFRSRGADSRLFAQGTYVNFITEDVFCFQYLNLI